MHAQDNIFFEEYKKLEFLCGQRCTEEEFGVRAYEIYMENMIPQLDDGDNWNYYVRSLKRCRHIRNDLAHKILDDENPLTRENDVEFIREFCQMMEEGRDLLSVKSELFAQLRSHKQLSRENLQSEETVMIMTPAVSYTPLSPPPKTEKQLRKEAWENRLAMIGGTIVGLGIWALIFYILAVLGECV